ncbi:hypothetical protein, partial [Porphyromonas cangingivalis]|uniref:hypothetical protein n=1 Tax=Porphyromonas cangingivalis TaxID=36874 RepID=UPI00242F5E7E
ADKVTRACPHDDPRRLSPYEGRVADEVRQNRDHRPIAIPKAQRSTDTITKQRMSHDRSKSNHPGR